MEAKANGVYLWEKQAMLGHGRIQKLPSGDPGNILFCLSHQHISQRALQTSLEQQLDPRGPIAALGGSVPDFLRKPIATCDFPW